MPQDEPGHTEVPAGVGLLHMVPLNTTCSVPEALANLKFQMSFLEVSPQVFLLSVVCKRNCACFVA